MATHSSPVVIVSQEDLAKNCGYVRRFGYILEHVAEFASDSCLVGFSSGRPLPSGSVYLSKFGGTAGRIHALVLGIVHARRIRAKYVLIGTIGAPYNAIYAIFLRLLGFKVVYDVQDPVVEILKELFGNGPLMRVALFYIGLCEALLDRLAAVTLVVGEGVRQRLEERGWRGPILTVTNIHGTRRVGQRGKSGIRRRTGWADARIAVYAGGLQRWRNIEMQIDACLMAAYSGHNVRLILVGFGEMEYFRQYIAKNGAEEFVILLEAVTPDDLADILADCDLAFSSEKLTYGMQSKIFEYLANGIRLISIDDNRDINRVFGVLFEYYDGSVTSLASAITRARIPVSTGEQALVMEVLESLERKNVENIRLAFS